MTFTDIQMFYWRNLFPNIPSTLPTTHLWSCLCTEREHFNPWLTFECSLNWAPDLTWFNPYACLALNAAGRKTHLSSVVGSFSKWPLLTYTWQVEQASDASHAPRKQRHYRDLPVNPMIGIKADAGQAITLAAVVWRRPIHWLYMQVG